HILGADEYYIQLKVNADSILHYSQAPYKAWVYWEDGQDSYHINKDTLYKNGRAVPGFYIPIVELKYGAYGNTLYYLTPEGLVRLRKDTQQLLFPIGRHQHPDRLQVQSPLHFFIYCRNDTVTELQVKNEHLFCSRVYTDVYHPANALTDRLGNTWIASLGGGLYYYPLSRYSFRTAQSSADWPGKVITELQVCGTQLIAGFDNGGIACFDKELKQQGVLLSGSPVFSPVKTILYDSISKHVVVAGCGISVWHANGKGVFYPLSMSHPYDKKAIYKDAEMTADGTLYLNDVRTLFRLDRANRNFYTHILLKSMSRKFALYPDTVSGKLWYSDIDGLHWLYKGQSRPVFSSHSFLRQRITDIKMLSATLLVLTSESAGVGIMDTSGTMLQLLTPITSGCGTISQTGLYGNQLWLAGERGINVYAWKENEYKPVMRINRNTGLLSDNVLSFCLDRNFLYVATTEGLQRLNMQTLKQQTDKPKLLIHCIRSKAQVWINPNGTIALPHNSREISVECSALAFGSLTPVTFAYRFEGTEGFIEVAGPVFSIPIGFEGKKKLYLRCRKGNSEWSEVKMLQLQIPVSFFHRWPVRLGLFLGLMILALLTSNYFAQRLRKRQLREQDLKLQAASWELRALQSMMNPHFVFNALNAVQHYITEHNNYQANKYLAKFSRIIRSILNSSREARSTLKNELDCVAHYLDLEQLRFGNKLEYTIHTSAKVDTGILLLPGMLLQPLAENAVIHAVMMSKKTVLIEISCTIAAGSLWIKIRDNGPGLHPSSPSGKKHESLGLTIISNRLQLLSRTEGKPYNFWLTGNQGTGEGPGVTAVLQLPVEYIS
ncbi:MAG TPA: histidine kinase, partial [Chitinophagaceae bacterium]|nr:histidine kinase [Chitinophagaceae bacterium]